MPQKILNFKIHVFFDEIIKIFVGSPVVFELKIVIIQILITEDHKKKIEWSVLGTSCGHYPVELESDVRFVSLATNFL